MTVHSFHLADVPRSVGARALMRPPSSATAPGLDHAECLALMRLGAPTVSPDRLQLRRMAMFAQWRDEDALERYLAEDAVGRHLAGGWHVRLEFLRRWSTLAALPGLPVRAGEWDQDEPVVAVTVARMRMREVPRFLHWGKPVERLVRDHPGVTLALAGVPAARGPSRRSRSGGPCVRWRRWCTAARPSRIRNGTPPRWSSAGAATSTTSSRRTASGRSRSTAPGRGGPASCRRAGG